MRSKAGLYFASFVAFAAIIAVFVCYVASLGIRVAPPKNRTALSLDVADISNIVVDSNVLLRGVQIGKVTRVDTSVASARIEFYIGGEYKIPVDSEVRLENLSALGESYIDLEPRSSGGPFFHDGQRVARGAVKQPPSISELAVSVVRVLNQMNPQQLSDVVGEADAGLPDPVPVLPNLARASLLLRNTTRDFRGRGRDLLDNFQVLLQNASFVGPAIAGAGPPIRDLGPNLNAAWSDVADAIAPRLETSDISVFAQFLQRIQKLLDDRGSDLRVLGEATSANAKLIANALKNFDSSQILANLLATVPEDGTVELHVALPSDGPAPPVPGPPTPQAPRQAAPAQGPPSPAGAQSAQSAPPPHG
jgi:phospholipid/cholesterol/gamma-HCH transport system substrate-binding protein